MVQRSGGLMTRAEYAHHRGCGIATVKRAVAAGLIPVTRPGQDGRIRVEEADAVWQPGDRQKPATPGGRVERGGRGRHRERDAGRRGADPDDEGLDGDPDNLDGELLDDELLRAQIRERRAKAALARMQVELARSDVIPRAEVVADATRAASEIRTSLRSLGSRVALRLECDCRKAAEVQAIIDREINTVLAVLNRTRFAPPEAATAPGPDP